MTRLGFAAGRPVRGPESKCQTHGNGFGVASEDVMIPVAGLGTKLSTASYGDARFRERRAGHADSVLRLS